MKKERSSELPYNLALFDTCNLSFSRLIAFYCLTKFTYKITTITFATYTIRTDYSAKINVLSTYVLCSGESSFSVGESFRCS